jgi:TraX protein
MTGTATPSTAKHARYGGLNSWDMLKLLGLTLMFADHTGVFIQTDVTEWRVLGRGAAVVFLFLAGFAPSARIGRDLVVLAFALLALNIWTKPEFSPPNILFTIMAARWLVARAEAGKLLFHKPYEWFCILLVLTLPLMPLFQYGSFGLMFAACGYMTRHAERYGSRTRLLFLLGTLSLYGALESAAMELSPTDIALLIAVLATVAAVLHDFRIRPATLPAILKPAEAPLRWLARHSLWVYAGHLAALQLITGIGY